MSLFIGNNTTEKVLHLYNGSSNIEENVFSGTSFHSSLPYYTFNSVHRFLPSGAPYNASLNAVWAEKQNYTISTGSIPTGDFSVVLRGMYNGVLYTFPTSIGEGVVTSIQAIYYGSPLANSPAFRLSTLTSGFTARAAFSSSIVAFPIATFDYIDVYLFNESITPITASDISISKNDISINGASLTSKIYTHFMSSISDRVNDYDTIIPIPSGGTLTALTYSRSTDNLTHTANGQYSLIQLINSYQYPVSSVALTSNPNIISVNKNFINIPLFNANTKFKSAVTNLPRFRILSYGQAGQAGQTTLISTMVISSIFQDGSILLNALLSKSGFYTLKDMFCVIPIIAGRRVTIITSDKYYIFGEISSTLNRINFYIYATSNITLITNIDCDVYSLS